MVVDATVVLVELPLVIVLPLLVRVLDALLDEVSAVDVDRDDPEELLVAEVDGTDVGEVVVSDVDDELDVEDELEDEEDSVVTVTTEEDVVAVLNVDKVRVLELKVLPEVVVLCELEPKLDEAVVAVETVPVEVLVAVRLVAVVVCEIGPKLDEVVVVMETVAVEVLVEVMLVDVVC